MPLVLPASTPLPFGPTTTGVALIGGSFLLVGWAVEETTAAATARIVLRDGNSASGQYRVPITLDPHESDRDVVAHLGVMFESGLFVDVTAGTVAGTILVIPTELLQRSGATVLVGQFRAGPYSDLGQVE